MERGDVTKVPKCRKPACTMTCWADGRPEEPFWGAIGVSEDYPGDFMHFCEGHGHPEDKEQYRPNPTISFGHDRLVVE